MSEYSKEMHILEIVNVDNMVSEVDKETLDKMGADVCKEYEVDKTSMGDWLERNELAFGLLNLKPEVANDPWPNSANTKLPLVLNAAMKASAEEFAEIMRGKELVKAEILGRKTPEKLQRAERVKKRMNHQFFHELEEWDEDHDKLIMAKNIIGTVHKKIFYGEGKIQSCLRRTGVVVNDSVEKIDDAPRITDEIELYWWQVKERELDGEWEPIDLTQADDSDFAESDKLNLFLEQVRREDLDGDGYPEPYIVTVHERTKQVVRITPNYTPESIAFVDAEGFSLDEYAQLSDEDKRIVQKELEVAKVDTSKARVRYVKYDMIPSWEGGYWGFGYGILLAPLNENCNKLVNQLINQGHLQSNGGGFINAGIKMGSGEFKFRMNEYKKVQSPGMDLARNIVPLPVKEPSQTLFSLLGLLMDVLKELSSVTEVMSGDQPKANMPAASIDMLITQGRKMFNAVYKRHYKSLTKEQNAVFDLNFLYQDPVQYAELLDLQVPPEQLMQIAKSDFSRDGIDLIPTANPEFSSKIQRMSEANAYMALKDDPRVNGTLILRKYVEAIGDDAEEAATLVPEQPNLTPEQAQQQMQQQFQEFLQGNEAKISAAKAQEAEISLQMKQVEQQMQPQKLQADLATKQVKLQGESVEGQLDLEKLGLEVQKLAIELEKARVELQKARTHETSVND